MPMILSRRFFRYFALALAAAQIVAFASAPVVEGTLAVTQVESALIMDGNAPDRSVPFHDPATCIVCQLISAVAPPPQPATILTPADEASGRESSVIDFPRQHVRCQGVLSRAPPTLPA